MAGRARLPLPEGRHRDRLRPDHRRPGGPRRDGLLGEIGHTKVAGHDEPCTCGSSGCLNTVASGAALAAQLREHGFDVHTAREVSELADRGVLEAVQAVRAAGRQIGEVMAGAINLLNPDVIAVWGYLVDAGDQFLVGMQEAIYKTALPASARAVSLARSPTATTPACAARRSR